jgi:hypothetical protein
MSEEVCECGLPRSAWEHSGTGSDNVDEPVRGLLHRFVRGPSYEDFLELAGGCGT